MSRKVVNLEPRKPGQKVNENAAKRIEDAIAAKGDGVAGQTALSLPAHGTTSSPSHNIVSPGGKGTRDNPRIRKDGTAMRSTTVHLPVGLAKRLTLYCATTEQRQSDVITRAVSVYLGDRQA